MIIFLLRNSMTFWWNSVTFPRLSVTTVIFHDFPGLKIPFLNSMTFQDAWEPGLASFCQLVEKPVFSAVKTGLAKIVFAGKNSFCQ